MKSLPAHSYFSRGFTLVEMLIVVSIIGVLAGVTISVLNVAKQRQNAANGIRIANMAKLVQGYEAFRAAEGRYPNNIAEASTYITGDPSGHPANSTYSMWTNAPTNDQMGGVVFLCDSTQTSTCRQAAKYWYAWGRIQLCDYLPNAPSPIIPLPSNNTCVNAQQI